MKLRRDDAKKLGWDGLDFWVYNDKGQFANASAAYFEVTGAHGRVKTTISDRIYYVLDGSGVFDIDGKQEHVARSDVVIVPRNTPYDYWATNDSVLKLFLVHSPAYDQNGEDRIPK